MQNPELQTRVRSIIGRLFQISPAEMEDEPRLRNPPQWDSIDHREKISKLFAAMTGKSHGQSPTP